MLMKNVLKFMAIPCTVLVLSHSIFAQKQQNTTEITITPCSQPPVVNGISDDSCWRNAARFSKKLNKTADGEVVQGKITYDAKWLYVLLEGKGKGKGKAVSVLLDPGANQGFYYQFPVEIQKNEVANSRKIIKKENVVSPWRIKWKCAVKQSQSGWTAEIAIPRFCLKRGYGSLLMDVVKTQMKRNVQLPEADQSDWINIKVAKRTWPQLAYPVMIKYANCLGYNNSGNPRFYRVLVRLNANPALIGKKATITLTDNPLDGKESHIDKQVIVTKDKSWPIFLNIPVSSVCKRIATVSVKCPENGIVQVIEPEDISLLSPMAEPILNRNYYTTEKQAEALCNIRMPEPMLKSLSLTATAGQNGKILSRKSGLNRKTLLAIPLKDLPVGVNSVIINLTRNNKTLCGFPVRIVRKAPKPGCEVKIDPVRRIILKDGKPFFPVGFMPSMIKSSQESDFKRIADGGFNILIRWNHRDHDPQEELKFLEMAAKYKLNVIANPLLLGKNRLVQMKDNLKRGRFKMTRQEKVKMFLNAARENMPVAEKAINDIKNHANLLGYYNLDEPHIHVFDIVAPALKIFYDACYRLDGYHPVFLLYGYGAQMTPTPAATDYCDVLGADPYWALSSGKRNIFKTPLAVSLITKRLRERANKVNKPIWIVPVAEIYSGTYKHVTTPAEQRVQTYLALIGGAKGITYFTYPVLHEDNWKELCKLADEIKELAPSLLGREIPQRIEYSQRRSDHPMRVALFEYSEGGYLLLAANGLENPLKITFTFLGMSDETKISRKFSSGTFPVSGGSFTDSLDGYAVRAYIIKTNSKLTEPVRIMVNTDIAQKAVMEFAESVNGRKNKKNIAHNPGFEDATLPGWPDYYFPMLVWPEIGTRNFEWGQDTTDPFEGKYCLKMKSTLRGSSLRSALMSKVRPSKKKKYVYSIYIKADNDNMQARFGLRGKLFKLTRNWKRYYYSPEKNYGRFWLLTYGKGTVWVDALQIEEGTQPTKFER